MHGTGRGGGGAENDLTATSEWIVRMMFFISSLVVVLVARMDKSNAHMWFNDNDSNTKQAQSDKDECQKSLWFVACLVGVYLHAPLLLANYSLGFPSSAFWSPLLASLVLPRSVRELIARNRAVAILVGIVKCLFLVATSPPIFLVPRIFQGYTAYVLGVYTPLHLILSALWFS